MEFHDEPRTPARAHGHYPGSTGGRLWRSRHQPALCPQGELRRTPGSAAHPGGDPLHRLPLLLDHHDRGLIQICAAGAPGRRQGRRGDPHPRLAGLPPPPGQATCPAHAARSGRRGAVYRGCGDHPRHLGALGGRRVAGDHPGAGAVCATHHPHRAGDPVRGPALRHRWHRSLVRPDHADLVRGAGGARGL